MGCCFSGSKTQPPMERTSKSVVSVAKEVLIQIPGCRVHLIDKGEAVELAQGQFIMMKIMQENVHLATIIKVGNDVQWPLTKDEPVVKVAALDYLFTLPLKDDEPFNYGVTFPEHSHGSMSLLDSLLKQHSCFSVSKRSNENNYLDWEEFAPRVEDYNHFLAKAIAQGTSQIVKGIFTLANYFTNQVHIGVETILNSAADKKNVGVGRESTSNKIAVINENLKRVRMLSNMTENLTKSLLDRVGIMSGSVTSPVVQSQPGQALLPSEVRLASLDSFNKVFAAVEAAGKQTFSATSQAATIIVSDRYGEEAGEATEHFFATTKNVANTTSNVSKIWMAINPASSATTTGALRNA
ncbi:senescence/dehydration-associated protein At4g35985, chloroplastic-like [Gastrolobium bilobum]|uniref:senescence/dehydration-associated protein At4g35985, chloroplastic-like n=1 Tax=Gastrolobium bilobum TaxID=150636 RepID=UPI002AAFA580|nr:senescence/dehydration-associated protein At4g35985, chloroplastic-like [Gastrolobium bilobum]